ncbi:MAG TPA: hypothetical protein VFV64_14170 [Permianibacter sp.]|nr:hypothetical protein [Permianibacter sp.]
MAKERALWPRKQLNESIESSVDALICELKCRSEVELHIAPPFSSVTKSIMGVDVRFTTFVERYEDGRALFLVRSDRKLAFGLISAGTTSGFWRLPDGKLIDASDNDVLNFFS